MKPTWAVRKPAFKAGRRRPRALSSWLWNYAGIAELGASGCDTCPMSRARVWSAYVTEVVARGSVVKTDGWPGYRGLTTHNDAHHVPAISSSGDPAVVVMPSVHLVAALLTRWLLGTFHGGVSREHLGYSLAEFTFSSADPRVSRTNTRWHTYDHWAETPGAHPTISRYIPVYPGISRHISDPFFCSRANPYGQGQSSLTALARRKGSKNGATSAPWRPCTARHDVHNRSFLHSGLARGVRSSAGATAERSTVAHSLSSSKWLGWNFRGSS